MRLVGVDAGGTRTVAVVGQKGNVVFGRGEARSANPQAVGFDEAAAAIHAAIDGALIDAGQAETTGMPVDRVVVGVAGAGRQADRAKIGELLAAKLGASAAAVCVLPDFALILPASGLGSGVAVVAGTGSSAFGVAPGGRALSAGGWGYLLGDDGSAFDVGRQALRAVAFAEDGLMPPTLLTTRMMLRLGVDCVRDLIPAIYQSPSPRCTIAALAPTVVDAAREGDSAACLIISRAGSALGRLVGSVARRLALASDSPVVGSGGLFQAGDLLLIPMARALRRVGLTDLRVLDAEPVLGALRLATGEMLLQV